MKVVHPTGVRIATLSGHVALLEPGVETEVPHFLGVLALGQGASEIVAEGETPAEAPAHVDPAPPLETVVVNPPVEPVVVISDHDRLVAIMKDIILRGSKDEFRADNTPKAAILNRLFGRTVLEEEREAAWAEATKVL